MEIIPWHQHEKIWKRFFIIILSAYASIAVSLGTISILNSLVSNDALQAINQVVGIGTLAGVMFLLFRESNL